MLVNGTQLAASLGVSPIAITKAVRAGRLIYADADKKLFDLGKAKRQWHGNGKNRPRLQLRLDAGSEIGGAILKTRLEREQTEARIAALKLKEREGELIYREVAERAGAASSARPA